MYIPLELVLDTLFNLLKGFIATIVLLSIFFPVKLSIRKPSGLVIGINHITNREVDNTEELNYIFINLHLIFFIVGILIIIKYKS